jgi:soluble lytic murein transglycosylase-like protein
MKISWQSRLRVIAIALLTIAMTALPCFAGEIAVLRNGFSIRHDRREVLGNLTRLYVNADGSSFVDVPTAEIEHFEAAPEAAGPATSGPEAISAPLAGNSPLAVNSMKPPSPVTAPVDLSEVVNAASGRYRLDPDLVNSVIKAESGFHVRAVSPKGAQGLMQLMPGTASLLGVPDAFDPQANVEGGTRYLRELLERYDFDLVKALAAYNAGPQRVEQFGGVPPYYETRAYVARIVRDFNKKKIAQEKAAKAAEQATSSSKKEAAASKKHTAGTKPLPPTQLQAKARSPQTSD